MYEFNNGTIQMICEKGVYKILVDGEEIDMELSPCQSRNPLLAIDHFTGEIDNYLSPRAKKYLREHGCNPITGCKMTGISCVECRERRLNISSTNCMMGACDEE